MRITLVDVSFFIKDNVNVQTLLNIWCRPFMTDNHTLPFYISLTLFAFILLSFISFLAFIFFCTWIIHSLFPMLWLYTYDVLPGGLVVKKFSWLIRLWLYWKSLSLGKTKTNKIVSQEEKRNIDGGETDGKRDKILNKNKIKR